MKAQRQAERRRQQRERYAAQQTAAPTPAAASAAAAAQPSGPAVSTAGMNPAFIVDTGASFHVVNCDHVGEEFRTNTAPIEFETAAGTSVLTQSTMIQLPGTDEVVEAMCSSESPNLCSVGTLVAQGWQFSWDDRGARLISPQGESVPLQTHAGAPMLSAAVMRRIQSGSYATPAVGEEPEMSEFFEWLQGAQAAADAPDEYHGQPIDWDALDARAMATAAANVAGVSSFYKLPQSRYFCARLN